MGSDAVTVTLFLPDTPFQSTLPGWGATNKGYGLPIDGGISIHAPRMGSDRLPRLHRRLPVFQSTLPGWGATFQIVRTSECFTYFNPRSPDGERPLPDVDYGTSATFQSTLPGWGATPGCATSPLSSLISIHAPRMGSDNETAQAVNQLTISIHAPRMGSDIT